MKINRDRYNFLKKIVPVPIYFFRLAFYLPIVLHELGHYLVGLLLGFPVQGIEIGTFPHRIVKLKKFTLRIGRFPRGGRTLLGFTSRTYSRWRQFSFILAGLGFEFLFFAWLAFLARKHLTLEIFLLIFYVDQLSVNFIPKYEKGRAVNDGGALFDILFPRIIRN